MPALLFGRLDGKPWRLDAWSHVRPQAIPLAASDEHDEPDGPHEPATGPGTAPPRRPGRWAGRVIVDDVDPTPGEVLDAFEGV